MDWSREPIRVFVHQHVDGAVVSSLEVIIVSRAANNIDAIVRRHLQLIDLINNVSHYTHTFELEYCVPFTRAHVGDIGKDMSASDILSGASDSTCMYYARMVKLSIYIPDIYELLPWQNDCNSDEAAIGFTHLDDRTLRVTDNDDALLFLRLPTIF